MTTMGAADTAVQEAPVLVERAGRARPHPPQPAEGAEQR